MNKIWLPPIETCCDLADFEIFVMVNQTLHIKVICKTHGSTYVKSPFASSKREIKVRFSDELLRKIQDNLLTGL